MVENVTGHPPKNEPVKIDTSTPLVIKDVEGATRWTKFTKSFTEQGKLQRDLEKSKLQTAKKNVESQEKITKDLRKQQNEMLKSVDSLNKAIDDKDEATYLKEIISAHGRNSKQAKDTQKAIEAGNLDYSKGSATIQTLQKKSAKLDSDAIASDSKQETYEKTLNTEKEREGGRGQKMLIKTLEKGQKWTKGMYESSMKVAKTGLKGAFIALGLMALIKFLDSDMWKGITTSIAKWVEGGGIVQIKGMLTSIYNYFFGPDSIFKRIGRVWDAFFGTDETEGPAGKHKKDADHGIKAGFQALWDNIGGISLLLGGIAAVTVLPVALAIGGFKLAWAAVLSPFKLVKGLIKGIAKTAMAAYGAARGLMGEVKDPKTGKWIKKPGSVNTKTGKIVGADGKDTVTKATDKGAKGQQKTIKDITKKPSAIKKIGGKISGGISKVKDTGSRMGQAMKGLAHLKKYPLLLKAAKRIPLLGPILSTGQAVMLLMSDASHEEKVKGLGGLLGGALGSAGFGMVGAALGSVFPGPGTVIGGILGSLGGWFGGEWLGTKLAGFLMGDGAEKITPPKMGGDPLVDNLQDKTGGAVKVSPPKGKVSNVRRNVSGQDIEEAEVASSGGKRAMGGRGAIMTQTTVAPVSNKVTNNQITSEKAYPYDRRLEFASMQNG